MRSKLRALRLLIIAVLFMLVWLRAYGAGFELRGPLTFAGYQNGHEVWVVGNGFRMIISDPTLNRRFQELEGKKISILVGEVR